MVLTSTVGPDNAQLLVAQPLFALIAQTAMRLNFLQSETGISRRRVFAGTAFCIALNVNL